MQTEDAALDPGESALVFQLPMNESEVGAWLDGAVIGDKMVYFVGHLAVARDPLGPFTPAKIAAAEQIGALVLRHAEAGRLELKQHRAAPGCYIYVAKRVH